MEDVLDRADEAGKEPVSPRVPDSDDSWAEGMHAGDGEPPLTAEMLDSLARLRRRLQEILFAPNVSARAHWASLPPTN